MVIVFKNKKMSKCIWSIVLVWGLCFSFVACTSSDEKLPDVSAIKIELKTQRLDRDLAKLDTNNLSKELQSLQQKYPDFLNFYLDTLMAFSINGNYTDTNKGIQIGLRSFLTYKDYRGLFDTVAVHFPDTKSLEQDLIKGFKYMKYYYPKYEIPKIVYFMSELSNWGVVSYDTVLGIGLDMFLGEKYPFYRSVGQPDYMLINFRPESIPSSVFSALYLNMHPYSMEDKTLLDMMLQKGKQQYFLQKVIPFIKIEDRIGYTVAQLDWCEKNEGMIYNFFLNKELIYEKNWQKMMRYVSYGPGSTGMPPEAPGNIGTWLGLQIIKAYSKANPTLTPEDIFSEKDGMKILKASKYKPK
jgi:hypothetical protein